MTIDRKTYRRLKNPYVAKHVFWFNPLVSKLPHCFPLDKQIYRRGGKYQRFSLCGKWSVPELPGGVAAFEIGPANNPVPDRSMCPTCNKELLRLAAKRASAEKFFKTSPLGRAVAVQVAKRASLATAITHAVCSMCGEKKHVSEFNKSRHLKGGIDPRCKVCVNERWAMLRDAKKRMR